MEFYTEEEIFSKIKTARSSKQKSFYLSKRIADELWINLGKELWQLTHLEEISCHNCGLTFIPDGIKNLVNLKKISLGDNELTSFPIEICELIKLEEIYCRDNKLSSIPKEIGNLKNLTDFDLSHNNLKYLPNEFSNLKSLKFIKLNNNNFDHFPEALSLLSNLEDLYLNDNNIKFIPPSLNNLKKLDWFDISNNQLLFLSKDLAPSIKNIYTIELLNNPFTEMPELLDKTIVEIYNILENSNIKDTFVAYWEVPDALKTSLQQYLNYFTDFVKNLTGENLHFEVTKTEKGLKLSTAPTEKLSIHDMNDYLSIYISQNSENTIVSQATATNLQQYQTKEVLNEWKYEKWQFDFKLQMLADKIEFLNKEIINKDQVILDQKITLSYFQDQNKHLLQFIPNPNTNSRQKFLPQITDKELLTLKVIVKGKGRANILANSPKGQINLKKATRKKVIERAQLIKEIAESDQTLSGPQKSQIIEVLAQMIVEAESKEANPNTYERLLGIASNVSSIGSLVTSLWPLITGKPI